MARSSSLNITYKGKDISKDISTSLLSFTYSDNEHGKADEIELVLENKKGLWVDTYYPEKGSIIEVGLVLYDWYKIGEVITVHWGRFTIDELNLRSTSTFSMKAISEKCVGAFYTEKRCRTFENISLKEMCEKIAAANNLKLIYKAQKNMRYKKCYQLYYTDASFIYMQVDKIGSKSKIANDKIIIYDSSIKDIGIQLYPENMRNYEFNSKTFNTYKACEVRYFNIDTGNVVVYRAEDANIKNDSVLVIDEYAESSEDAKNIAESELKKANNKEITGSISLMGNPEIFTGCEFEIIGVGVFSGKYIVEKVTHSISNSQGYITSLECYLKR